MAPINKKIRAIVRSNSNASASTTNGTTCSTPTTTTTTASTASNQTTVITSTASGSTSSGTQGAKTSDSNNGGSSESEPTEGSSSKPGTPHDEGDDPNSDIVMGENYPNLSYVGRPKRSSITIPTPSSVSNQYGKLLHSSSQRRENRYNVINHQYTVPSPASSPIDPHAQPFSYSASSSSSSLSPSPSTSTQDKSDSPSSIYLYENGTRRQSVISSGDRSSPNTSRKGMNDESPVEHRHDFNLRSQYKHDAKNADGSSSSSQSGKITIDKSSEEYRLRRERNNIAVRKSRSKSKIKFLATIDRMHQLEEENSKLHNHIAKMNQELSVLKFLLTKYQEGHKSMMKLDHVDAMDIPPDIRMMDRVEIGSDRFQIRNFGNSRSNINPFYSER